MQQKLSYQDIFALGFMNFAFFLGAGNIIFPPLAGALAGEEFTLTTLGFLVTAVGLPLITLLAVAKAGGGILTMARYLPAKVALVFALVVYIIIGPSFATPRAALVAFEIGFKPFISHSDASHLALFSVIFFGITAFLSLRAGKLLDWVGKVITPMLILSLLILAIAVFINPQAEVGQGITEYTSTPFIKGFLEGYNTMDTLASLIFGMFIINIIRSKGITSAKGQYKYLMLAGSIAVIGLAFVYISLFYLGATSHTISPNPANGGELISHYVTALFGPFGQYLLSFVVATACLTTAVGLVSAMADFIAQLKPKWPRATLVIINCALCALVTNVGLAQLISLSVPVLYTVYPVAIALVVLTLFKSQIRNKQIAYALVLFVALIFGLLDGLKVAGMNMHSFDFIPLFALGMAWVIPTAITLFISLYLLPLPAQSELTSA
ncbi:branched-chain amino acid transport system II carrier protein [Psychromonas sp. RZ22]|uniref:branched-chain amino acid transport system II carrier protein n=1 Tax=Psychromonas algarum TaxID=2555643 RepID=UPI001067986D|nr:branched-chain amino acid transport system II carrier protein [Psychromonas sp. RZ22]TEW55173.1 branched-chain amino acid transport system II carrier protein [Psychromonas sp. RZ22]